MNRGRQRSARPPAAGGQASIDLGFTLSVYGKDADGRLVAIQHPDMPDARWDDFSGPTHGPPSSDRQTYQEGHAACHMS